MANNPSSYPGTILEGTAHLDALTRHFGNIIEQTEKYKQREELKQAGLEESLLPPDLDLGGISERHREEITMQMQGYEKERLDFLNNTQGMTPEEIRAKKSYFSQKEREISNDLITAKQIGAIDSDFIKKKATKEYLDNFDDPQSMANLAQLRELGISDANKFIQEKGSLFVGNPWNPTDYLKENIYLTKDMMSENPPEFYNDSGHSVTKTVSDFSPEQKTAQVDYLLNGAKGSVQYKAWTQGLFDALTVDQKAKFEQDAIVNGSDALVEFAKRDLPQSKTGYTSAKNSTSGGGGGGSSSSGEDDSPIMRMIAGIYSSSDEYMQGFSGSAGQVAGALQSGIVKEAAFINIPLAKFPQKDPATGKYKDVPEIIESFVADKNGRIIKISNKSKELKENAGGIAGGHYMTPQDWNVLVQTALDGMTVGERKAAMKLLNDAGAYDASTGNFDLSKLATPQTTQTTTTPPANTNKAPRPK